MPVFNYPKKEVNVKVVYYGPGLSGKTTNLQKIHEGVKPEFRGKLISLATQTDRTLFFDFMPMELGSLGGYKIRLHLYTVPGQVHYNATRKLVLKGVDGVVFIADSQRTMNDANIESVLNLEKNLQSYGKSLAELPHVIQANKRDLDDVISMEEVDSLLNYHGAVLTEAAASESKGVMETLTEIVRLVMKELRDQFSSGSAGLAEPSTRPAHEPENETEPEAPSPDVSAEAIGDQSEKKPEPELEVDPEPGSDLEAELESDTALVPEPIPESPSVDISAVDDEVKEEGSIISTEAVIDETEDEPESVPELEPEPSHEPLPEVDLELESPSVPENEPGSFHPIKILLPMEGLGALELSISVNARIIGKGDARNVNIDTAAAILPESEPDLNKTASATVEASPASPPAPVPEIDLDEVKETESLAEEVLEVEPPPVSSNDLPPLGESLDEPLGSPLDGQEPDDLNVPELPQEEKILLDEDLNTEMPEASASEPAAGYDPTVPSMDFDFPETGTEEPKPKKGLFGRFGKKK